ncbi:putative phage abortive infection protein [Chryseobacterium sp. RG1]|uniref:Phage abortive infection protein n=1 Tax=Chryseobacterium tagetis TaxID=2801334 RepID=A0ABS7ZYW1_9FLAO|nr:putative phage abortive infection protein [Chryseobacterium tagetis]MCA6065805.1 putative phage abortive infection protein [Chryseobacterium tagetis]
MMIFIKKYWPLALVIIVYLILLLLYFIKFHASLSSSNEKWGTFGDFLGGSLSPLIGIISIVLTYNIINNQNKENRQSEFKYIFQILFDSVDIKRDVIRRKFNNKDLKGIDAINRINKDIESTYNFEKKNNVTTDNLISFQTSFWSVYDDINESSSPFMKVLHNCLKMIDKQCLDERKEEYASLLRAQLHSDELIFIFYNAIASDDFKAFKKRIEKYSILKDVAGYDFPMELRGLYSNNAFEEDKKEIKKIIHTNKIFSFELNFTFSKK